MSQVTSIVLMIAAFLLGVALGGFIASIRQEKKTDDRPAQKPSGDQLSVGKDVESGLTQAELEKPTPVTPEITSPAAPVVIAEPPVVINPGTPSAPGITWQPEDPSPGESKKTKRVFFLDTLINALGADVSTTRLPPKSIAVQVNDILQKKLKDTPLEDRGICLIELPGKDMVVMIGLDRYDSVSAVPDDQIRAVIQSAVNDWLVKSSQSS